MDDMDFVIDFVENDMQYEDFNKEQLEHLRKECEAVGVPVRADFDEREFYSIKKALIDRFNRYQKLQRDIKESMDKALEEKAIKASEKMTQSLEEIAVTETIETINEELEPEAMEETTMNKATNESNNATVNATVETTNNTTMEGETMNNTTVNNETVNVTADTETVTAAEKAKAFATASKEKLENGFKFAVKNVEEVGAKAKELSQKASSMSEAEFEEYLMENGKSFLDKIVAFLEKRKEGIDAAPTNKFTVLMKEKGKTFGELIGDIKEALDDKEVGGWGKFKAVVKMVAGWLVKLFLKAASIVLKIAFVTLAGVIKMGFTAISTTIRVAGVVNKEVVKPVVAPTFKAIKTRIANHKAKAEDFDDIEEELFADEDLNDIELTEDLVAQN